MRNVGRLIVLALLVAVVGAGGMATDAPLAAATSATADWPCWRGPTGDGMSPLTGIRTDFSGGLPKLWEASDLCKGSNSATWSAPSISGDRLVVLGRQGASDVVFCYEADTGKLVWKKHYPAPGSPQYGHGPRATPAIDGDRVYTFGAMGHLVCWQLTDGKQLWMRKIAKEGAPLPVYGHSSSPLVVGGKVVVQCGGKTLVIACDKLTGEVAWRSMTGKAAYAALTAMTVGNETHVIVFTAAGAAALAPADGKVIWSRRWKTPHDVNCSTPVVADGKVFITSSMGKGSQLIELDESGTGAEPKPKPKPKPVWTNKAVLSYHSDPIVLGRFLYTFSGLTGRGDLRCVDLKTGRVLWVDRRLGYGTMVHVDGHLLCLSNRGVLALVRPDPEAFRPVTKFQAIKGSQVWTMPVVARGNVYIRHGKQLICYKLIE